LLLAVNQGADVICSKLEPVPVRNGVSRAGFYTVPTEDTARIVDVVNARVALSGRNPLGIGIFGSLNIDTVSWTGRRTKKTTNAFFEPVLVAMEYVNAPIAGLKVNRFVWIVFGDRFAPHGAEGHTKSFCQCGQRRRNLVENSSHDCAVYQQRDRR